MYARSRDYCTSTKHVVELCRNIIKVQLVFARYLNPSVCNTVYSIYEPQVNVFLKKWGLVYSHFLKAESALEREVQCYMYLYVIRM